MVPVKWAYPLNFKPVTVIKRDVIVKMRIVQLVLKFLIVFTFLVPASLYLTLIGNGAHMRHHLKEVAKFLLLINVEITEKENPGTQFDIVEQRHLHLGRQKFEKTKGKQFSHYRPFTSRILETLSQVGSNIHISSDS